jgi:uncharacterized protein (DUF1684 family)
MITNKNLFILIFFAYFFLGGCAKHPNTALQFSQEDSLRITNGILKHRFEADSSFRFDPSSPFNKDSSIHFDGIKWFPIDIHFHFKSKLFRFEKSEIVTVYGTKGEERKHLKYGYFIIPFNGEEHRLNVYKFTGSDTQRYQQYKNYLSVWFTDETTGKETYNVGRYVEIGDENPDPNFIYTIDFNNAYNPYCAYSATFSCAIPLKEDHLNFSIRAGEMKYHQ